MERELREIDRIQEIDELVSRVREIKERLGSADRIKEDSVIELDQIIEDLEKAEIALETAKVNLQDLSGFNSS